MFSKILLVVLLLLPISASVQVFNREGKVYDKVQQRSRKPIVMIDTITVQGQFASMNLSSNFGNGRHSVIASSPEKVWAMITQISTDSTDAVRSYIYTVKDKGRRLLIKANNATDTTKVVVIAWIL